MEQISIRAGRYQTADQAVFKHVAGAAGILADDDSGRTVCAGTPFQLGIIPAQETTDFKRMVSS